MASNIPTRRLTRATRLPDENAVKGRVPLVRGTTKSGAGGTVAGPSKPTTNRAALDANLQNKRKREALGEVTNNDKNKTAPKGVSKDGKIVKPHVLINSKPDRPTIKAPARKTRGGSVIPSKETEIQDDDGKDQEQEGDEDAMVVDEPVAEPVTVPTLHRVARRLTTRSSTTVTTVISERQVNKANDVGDLISGQSHITTVNAEKTQLDDEDIQRAYKRRRTSSEADVEAVVETTEANESPAKDVSKDVLRDDAPVPQTHEEEEEAEVIGWEDLDKEDFDDPYMVSEYVVDIFKYLSDCEIQTLPNPNYMQRQENLDWYHRGVLMDYLIGLHHRFRMLPETLYLAVNIIDRFLSMRIVSLPKLQLVGLSGLFIAAKFEEICSPSVQNLLAAGAMQEDTTKEEMLKAERYILMTLNWNVSLYPQPMNWLRRISKADDYDPEVRSLAKFFLEIHVVEKRLLGVKPSLIAAASIWLGRLVLNHFGWTPNLAHYSGYSEKKIIPVANIMLNYCLRRKRHENFIQKYASKKYSKVGVFIHDWVTSRWTVGTRISLADELPYLAALAAEKGD